MSKLSMALGATILAGAATAAPQGGPLLLCQAPAWSADTRGVVAWVEGHELVLAATRERAWLPAYLLVGHQPPVSRMSLLRMPLDEDAGLALEGERVALRLSPGLTLECAPTRED